MAAFMDTIEVPAGEMTPVSDGLVQYWRGSNDSRAFITLCASLTSTAPTSEDGGVPFPPGVTFDAEKPLSVLFPNFPDGCHLFAFCRGVKGRISVSHA